VYRVTGLKGRVTSTFIVLLTRAPTSAHCFVSAMPEDKLDWSDERKCNAHYVFCFAREQDGPSDFLGVWRKIYAGDDEPDSRWRKLIDNGRIASMRYNVEESGSGSKTILKKYPRLAEEIRAKAKRDYAHDPESPKQFRLEEDYPAFMLNASGDAAAQQLQEVEPADVSRGEGNNHGDLSGSCEKRVRLTSTCRGEGQFNGIRKRETMHFP
jgi:hypothetical protein